MKFSVIIPFYNAQSTLERCLQALDRQIFKDFEVCLVDNHSDDHSAVIARDFAGRAHPFEIRVLHEPRRGAPAARNTGAAAARGEWLAFTDADCVPAPHWLHELDRITASQDSGTGAVAGTIVSAVPENPVQLCSALFTLPPVMKDETFRELTLHSGGFPTANLAVRRAVFEEVGGFDYDHPVRVGEDTLLCARLYRAGYAIRAHAGAAVEHVHREDLRSFVKQARAYGESHPYIVKNLLPPGVLVEPPAGPTLHLSIPLHVWIDLRQADKKMLGAVLAAVLLPPLWFLPFVYFMWLCRFVLRKMEAREILVAPRTIPVVAGLLLLKSGAVTSARIKTSFRYRCLVI